MAGDDKGGAADPEKMGANMGAAGQMSYSDFLGLDQLLNAQKPLSQAHDEMLFIIQHQTTELWMKLALHELEAAREAIRNGQLSPAFKMLARVARIFEQMMSAWDVLRTMTPIDYSKFRDILGQSSGFQSWQYRLIEFMMGNRNPHMIKPHRHSPDIARLLEAEMQRPSLYHTVIELLVRTLDGPIAKLPDLPRDRPHQPVDEIRQLWVEIYRQPDAYWDLYELAEKLVDMEDFFRRWRFNHVTTVERIIGFKRGTGGTAGVHYLKKMLEVELFPELWHLRVDL